MLNTLNTQLFFWINHLAGQNHFFDNFFVLLTNYSVQIIILLALIWFFVVLPIRTKDPIKKLSAYKNAGLLFLSLFFVWPVVEFIKAMVAYPRPFQILSDVHTLVINGHFDSFPSLHTAFAFAIATFIYHYHKKTGFILFFLAILIGFSRIYVGTHFPIDVLVGAIVGALIPSVLVYIFKGTKA